MNRNLSTSICILLGSLLAWPALAQPISSRDSDEIKLLAKRKVERGLNDLLNVLTFEDLEESQRKAIVARSYADSIRNRLFYNTDVIIEDDLQPDRPIDQPVDLKVDKYLANLDLFYTKSVDRSVEFSNVNVSAVKERVYPYVNVFYTQFFSGKNNRATAAFRAVPRVAEVRAERVGKKWNVMIMQVGFPKPGETVNSPINNVKLVEPEAPVDSAALLARQEQEALLQAQLAKEREQEQMALKVYRDYLAKGDKAVATKDYPGALLAYAQAEKLKPSDDDILPGAKIDRVNRLMNAAKIADRELLRDYREKADLARKKRQYADALGYYHKILDKFPDSTALITVIKELTQKSAIKTEYDEQYASGQYDKLVDEYDKLIKRDNTNSDWYLGRAKCYLKLNKDDRALRDLTKSLELDYANLDAILARADLYRKLNNLPKAVADYSAYLIIDPKSDDIFSQRAQLRVRTGNLTSADDDFTQAITLNPAESRHHFDRGLLRFRTQKYDLASTDFGQAVETAPTQPDAYFYRGLIYATQKEYAPAGADFTKAMENKLAAPLMGRIDSIATSLYTLGQQANEAKNYDQAIAHLTNALAVRNALPRALYERGLAHLSRNNYAGAVTDLTASIALAPAEEATFSRRADAYMAQAKNDLAAADYKQSVTLNPANYAALLGEATALVNLKKFTEAIPPLVSIKTAQKKIEKNYTPVFFRDVFYRLATCELATDQYEKAVDDYTTALKYDEAFTPAYAERAAAYEGLVKYDRAIDDYQRAIARKPGQPELYFAKASALEKKGDYKGAIDAYSELIVMDSARRLYPQTVFRRGTNYLLAGQYKEALEDLGTPLVQGNADVCQGDCWLNTGLAHLYAGQPDAGMPYLAKCMKSPSVAPRAAYAMACAHLQKDNEAEALTWFEKALATKELTSTDLKKDKLIDVSRKDFRKNKSFKQLVDKYAK